MFVLKEGRRPFLEFLRNLTPCALLFSTAIVLFVNLDFRRVDWSNWANTLGFFSCSFFACVACLANASLFLDASLESLERFSRVPRALGLRTKSHWRIVVASLRLLSRRAPAVFYDLMITMLVMNVGLLVVLIAAVNGARSALR